LLALAQYLLASGDGALLDERLPFFHPQGEASAEHGSVLAHVQRALALIDRRVIPGTRLAAYGHGDWNDSLQPADPALAEQLCSAWTVTLHHQTVDTLAQALRHVGRAALADKLEASLGGIRDDFQRLLINDGVVAGYARFRGEGDVAHWLHPSDRATGVRYSLLPMVHGILSNLFTPEQAARHVQLIRQHLLATDGARLFDRPPAYQGGLQRHFQRAESSTFFGREIGLMYTHAHLRYAEALARYGDADAFFEALRRAIPIGIQTVVAAAAPRQANCYYSSSDAAVADRYEAAERYADVRAGRVPLEGGWRVYSSGAGITVYLIHHCLLGVRRGRKTLGIDPVIPKALDGLCAEVELGGHTVRVRYRVAAKGCGPIALTLNGHTLPMTRASNPYRTAGVTVPMASMYEHMCVGMNDLLVALE
jgi:cellobiose phosphorylase